MSDEWTDPRPTAADVIDGVVGSANADAVIEALEAAGFRIEPPPLTKVQRGGAALRGNARLAGGAADHRAAVADGGAVMSDDIDAARHGAFDEGWDRGFRAGAEAMRERAAALVQATPQKESLEWRDSEPFYVITSLTADDHAAAIRALPVPEGEP